MVAGEGGDMFGAGFMGRHEAVENRDSPDGDAPGRRDPIRWLIACGVLLVAAIAVGTAMTISNFRDHALESSERELQNTVLLLARHFDQQFDDLQIPVDDLIKQIHAAGIASPEDFRRELSTRATHLLIKAEVSGSSEIAGINI